MCYGLYAGFSDDDLSTDAGFTSIFRSSLSLKAMQSTFILQTNSNRHCYQVPPRVALKLNSGI